ncbi:MAG: type IV secretory system conjugative DNA transfer family protein [Alphaproteobacteria bacterium]|nr:type IV secretory system conjugative DNA transfer family protein [Alphaproteobacteria bacterium]
MAIKFNFLSASGKGKGLGIFDSTKYKEHEQTPLAREFWSIRWAIIIWLIGALMFAMSFPAEQIWRYGWSPATRHWIGIYLYQMVTTLGMSVVAEIPAWIARAVARPDWACIAPLIPIIGYYFLSDATMADEFNPHSKDKFEEKTARVANEADIKKMAADWKNKNGLFGGFMMVLGYFKGKALKMDECLSALLLAPAGTGKTIGCVIPTILECDNVSMIVNDPKPELDLKTSAYRATVGPVFILNWAARDEPEKGIYYPAWNPLSPENLPATEEEKSTYIQVIVNTIIEENAKDPHWSNTARAALTGFVNFIVSKVERAKANDYFYSRLSNGTFDAQDAAVLMDYYMTMSADPNAYAAMALLQRGELNINNYVHVGTWAGLPKEWHGAEASIPMFLAWYVEGQIKVAQQIEERKRQGDQMVMMADPMKDFLNEAVNEAQLYSYDSDAVSSLINLANTPDKERGSVISTMNAGLNIFRHPAVNKHTRHSDLHFGDLRGMVDPRDGKVKPVTVYLSMNVADAPAFRPITSMFVELLSNFLIAHKPEDMDHGQKLGPYPTLFVLDEMPTMNKLEAVIQGPAVGRGQKVSYLIVGQDISQIAEKYGDKAADTVIANSAAKIILRVNDPATAQRFTDMIGKKKVKKKEKGPDGKDTEVTKEEDLFSPMDLMTLKMGKQLVLFQGFYNRPIEAEALRYFEEKTPKEKEISAKVKMGRAAPIPEYLVPHHHRALRYPGAPRVYDPETKQVKELTQ